MAGITRKGSEVSLSEIYETIRIPAYGSWWKRLFAFLGPAYLVSVGYMDPGNWATDIEGGARFGYQLLWVILMSNLMAIVLQSLSARLGIARRRDLAQACREAYPPIVAYPLWILSELAIAATDLAEVLGTAIGLNLLLGIPLLIGVVITLFDTLLLLLLQRFGVRKLEAFILSLVAVVGVCFIFELVLSKPNMLEAARGLIPRIDTASLYIALGIIGATVMPHNLYLHSALVQSRAIPRSEEGVRLSMRFNLIDTVIALQVAFLINSAILLLSASVFHARGVVVTELQQAHELLSPLLGTSLASIAFAVALLAAGQSSTVTGTLAGQIVMEGFIQVKMQPWARRLISRLLAVVPALIVISLTGSEGSYRLLILSQVILSLQLPFAIVPLIHFTSDSATMGKFASPLWLRFISWIIALIIIGLNAQLVFSLFVEWMRSAPWLSLVTIPVGALLLLLLSYMGLRPWLRKLFQVRAIRPVEPALPRELKPHDYKKIGVALEVRDTDVKILTYALPFAIECDAEIILIHIVESATAQVFSRSVEDRERIEDEDYLSKLVEKLKERGIRARYRIGFGNAARGVVEIAKQEALDLLVLGSHGHKALQDLIFGSTVAVVQHSIGDIPILVVKGT